MSRLCDFLTTDYAHHFDVQWDSITMHLKTEMPVSVRFEIADKQDTIQQPSGMGVSIIRRNDETIEVIDIEDFTKTIHGEHNTPNSCDFAISPEIGNKFILLNELTQTESRYILPFRQPTMGVEKIGKLEYAKLQLLATIERFYEVSNFCDQYNNKLALFSCRLSDKRGTGIMVKSAKAFSKPIYCLQRMKLNEKLPHGFIFKMCVYDAEYRIP